MAVRALAVFRREGAHLAANGAVCVLTGVIRRSEPFGANDTCDHLYLFLRPLQKQLLDFSSVRLQFIYCSYKLAKTSED